MTHFFALSSGLGHMRKAARASIIVIFWGVFTSWLAPTVSEAQTGNNFTVTSFSASPNPVQPGGVLTVSATIGSNQPVGNYIVGFQAKDLNNQVVWQQFFPNLVSATGGSITENWNLPIPTSAPPGTYQFIVGVWDPNWGWYTGASTIVTVGGAPLAAPVNAALPVISGTAQVGMVLTSSTGTWTGATSFSYQWSGDGTPIAGATASTYTPAVSDVGNTLTVAVTATGSGGTASATSAATAPVASATAAPPVDIQLPVISGTAQVGKVLTSSTGTWTGATSYAYQWATNNALINGATASIYTPVSGNAGATLTATVTAAGSGGTASATSAPTVPIVAASGGGGATYYVSKSGNDSNSGASNAPWLTIGHALATATTPGSTIIVGAGTYQELVRFTTSGTSGNPITLMANPGSSVTIDGGSASSGPDRGGGTGVVTFNNVSYVNLYGFNITNGYESCIYGTGSSSGTPTSANINVEFNTCNSSFSTSAGPCGSGANCAIIANYWGQSWNVSNNYINRTNCSTNQHTLEYLGSYNSTISNNVIASNCNGDGIVIKNSGGKLTVTQNQVANLSPHFNACIYVDVESGNSYQNSCVVNNMTAQNNLCDGVSGQANGGQTINFNHEQACAGGTTGRPGDITNSTFTNNVLPEAVVNATNSYNPSGYPLSGTAISPNTIEAQAPLGLLFTASQYFVASGGSVTLSWSPMNSSTSPWKATNLSSCTASGGWSGSKAATSGTNTQTISGITTTTTYTLTCTDSAGSPVAVSIPITVPIP